ncbi:hypothetical protein ElyMa_006522000 [Elysia marginata]|uniref:Uncharacterized protein n=1 Tax=Elysia marginata TaxID=1093978 RepID=A0AAV4I6H3_9GAST|nr:hypothetical protein ElyMa_006522000 [Elysia marginata]
MPVHEDLVQGRKSSAPQQEDKTMCVPWSSSSCLSQGSVPASLVSYPIVLISMSQSQAISWPYGGGRFAQSQIFTTFLSNLRGGLELGFNVIGVNFYLSNKSQTGFDAPQPLCVTGYLPFYARFPVSVTPDSSLYRNTNLSRQAISSSH